MIEYRTGNVLQITEGIIVHGCNCQGAMGAGIALQIRQQFPNVYEKYKEVERLMGLTLGKAYPVNVGPDKWIVNALTQQNTGTHARQVSYDAIATCFEDVLDFAKIVEESTGKRQEIVFPQIGAGLAGGNWKIIETIIDETIPDDFKKAVYIYKP